MSNGPSIASYAASVTLFCKGLAESAANAWATMPMESKIGVALGVGTFCINWYYRRREDRRRERLAQAQLTRGTDDE